jgi:pSer/pThr/pTyr-binding forkhead associated (FHA) protein
MRFIRKPGASADKSPKRLHVEPAELARKLIKEMDDHAVSRGGQVWVRNRYVVYLCPEDYQSLTPRREQVTADLANKLVRHVHDRGYNLQADLSVEMVLDHDLELGYFGILAQKVSARQPGAEPAPQPGPVAADVKIPAGTEVLAAEQAEEFGLTRRVIVINSGDQVREFSQTRVVVGRAKEADLRIDDPNVSRAHAAIYWNDGRLMIDDLGSTNGTMVNGYPITSTVLRPRDVVAIGESRLTVEIK